MSQISSSVEEGGPGHCPVCGGDLISDLVYCSGCSTPHHEECWLFTGRCAIYACDSRICGRSRGGPTLPATVALSVPDSAPPVAREAREANAAVAVLAHSKRQAFREWLRDLIDEGIGIPQGWASLRASRRTMPLVDLKSSGEESQAARLVVYLLLGFIPLILVLACLGAPTVWFLPEFAFYLGLTALLHAVSLPVTRQLVVDTQTGRLSIVSESRYWRRRRHLAELSTLAAVAILEDSRAGPATDYALVPGIVLVDGEQRLANVPDLELCQTWEELQDDYIRHARSLARFLELPFIGVIDMSCHRRRLPPRT